MLSIDRLIDAFVARFADRAIDELPLWIRPIVRKILAAFYALDIDAELKRLIDEWLNGDRRDSLESYVLKRHSNVESTVAFAEDDTALDPFTILSLISLAIRLFNLLKVPTVGAESAGDVVKGVVLSSEVARTEQAFEAALGATPDLTLTIGEGLKIS